MTSRNDRFLKGGFSGLMIAAAILCGAFAVTAANLPAGYTKVEYIQGDGSTGYLVTDFSPDPSNDTIVAEAMLTSFGNNVNPQFLFESADMTIKGRFIPSIIIHHRTHVRHQHTEDSSNSSRRFTKVPLTQMINQHARNGINQTL